MRPAVWGRRDMLTLAALCDGREQTRMDTPTAVRGSATYGYSRPLCQIRPSGFTPATRPCEAGRARDRAAGDAGTPTESLGVQYVKRPVIPS